MSEVKRRNLIHLADQDEPPPKKLISNADVFIKQLAEKQRNTVTNLQQELAKSKEFMKATELIPLGSNQVGTSSLRHFQETTEHLDRIQMLKSAGLVDDEIQLFFDGLKGDEYVFRKHKNCEVSLLKQRVREIQDTVKQYEEKQTTVLNDGEEAQKRRGTEYGLSVKPDSVETKLLKFALENQKDKSKLALPHPMDNIKQIEQQLFPQLTDISLPSISKIRRKARKLGNRILNVANKNSIVNNCETSNTTVTASLAKHSKWDVTETETEMRHVEKKTYRCLPQNYYTIRKGEIVKLNKEEIDAKGLEVTSRLSIDEIKMLPKFENYERGNPSKILYIRNLSNGIKERDLRQLFKNYDDDNQQLACRMMNGKMRGQAFITFQDQATASRALDEVNGIVIKNRPVIIQFGCAKDKI